MDADAYLCPKVLLGWQGLGGADTAGLQQRFSALYTFLVYVEQTQNHGGKMAFWVYIYAGVLNREFV